MVAESGLFCLALTERGSSTFQERRRRTRAAEDDSEDSAVKSMYILELLIRRISYNVQQRGLTHMPYCSYGCQHKLSN